MDQKSLDGAFVAAARLAADRGIVLDQAALTRAVFAVVGTCNGQNDPEEIAEDALELLGKGLNPSAARRGRRPF